MTTSDSARSLVYLLSTVEECRRVPRTYTSDGVHRSSRAQIGLDDNGTHVKWIAFSFQSVRATDVNMAGSFKAKAKSLKAKAKSLKAKNKARSLKAKARDQG